MNVISYPPQSSVATGRKQPGPVPVQPTTAAHDVVTRQREAARRLAAPEQQRQAAELLAAAAGQRIAQDAKARKAIAAYQGIAAREEREYVRHVLGISEFA